MSRNPSSPIHPPLSLYEGVLTDDGKLVATEASLASGSLRTNTLLVTCQTTAATTTVLVQGLVGHEVAAGTPAIVACVGRSGESVNGADTLASKYSAALKVSSIFSASCRSCSSAAQCFLET